LVGALSVLLFNRHGEYETWGWSRCWRAADVSVPRSPSPLKSETHHRISEASQWADTPDPASSPDRIRL